MTESRNPQNETARITPPHLARRPAPPPAVAPKQVPPTRGTESKRPPAPPMARSPDPLRRETVPAPAAPEGHLTAAPVPPAKSPPGVSSAKSPPLNASSSLPGLPVRGSSNSSVHTEPGLLSPVSNQPPPKSPVALSAVSPRSIPGNGPRRETGQIAPADPPIKRAGRLNPVQSAPADIPIIPPASVAKPLSPGLVESVPMPFCWALLGVSALVLIIQLWTYFS